MPNAAERLQVIVIRASFWFLILLTFAPYCAGATEEPNARCFEIRMSKDGRAVEGPISVTFLDEKKKQTVDIQEGRFCVPKEMAGESDLDLTFVVGGERFYLTRVSIARFEATWDIAFGGKTYARSLPKSMNPKKACTVIFRSGEPEVGRVQSPCRVPAATPIH